LLDQFVDLLLSITQITTFDKVLELPLVEAASRAVKLKWPQEVRGLLKVGADCVYLVDQVLHADHAVLAKVLLNDFVVSQGTSLLVDLAISSLCTLISPAFMVGMKGRLTVDEFANRLLVRVPVGDKWLND
jgi:hypothetical protein